MTDITDPHHTHDSFKPVRAASALRTAGVDFLGGTAAGVALVATGHPLDTLKVRLQTQPVDRPLYSGLGDCFRKTIRHEGIGGLYKGMASPLVGQSAFNAWQFFLQGQAIAFMRGEQVSVDTRLTTKQYFMAGAMTGAGVAFVEAPQDLFKSQLQVQVFKKKPAFTSVWGCIKHIFKQGGVRGVYQGLGATIVRNTFSVSMYFGFYEMTRSYLADTANGGTGDVADLSALQVLTAGAAGGVMYWGLNYPCDAIKSSMQGDETLRANRRYTSVIDCARKMYAEGGMARMYRGYAPCMMRSVPANAACFLAYETVKKYLL